MCHICLIREATTSIKCKLCCDGMEEAACIECAQIYRKIQDQHAKAVLSIDIDEHYMLLVARRKDGWEKLRGGK